MSLSHPYLIVKKKGQSASCLPRGVWLCNEESLIVRIQPIKILYQHLRREMFTIPHNSSRCRGLILRPLLPHSINSSINTRRTFLLIPLLWDNRNRNTSNSDMAARNTAGRNTVVRDMVNARAAVDLAMGAVACWEGGATTPL